MAAKLSSEKVKRIKRSLSKGADICLCCFCGNAFTTNNLTIEHIIPKSQGGTNKLNNLALSCDKCNNERKTIEFSFFKLMKMG